MNEHNKTPGEKELSLKKKWRVGEDTVPMKPVTGCESTSGKSTGQQLADTVELASTGSDTAKIEQQNFPGQDTGTDTAKIKQQDNSDDDTANSGSDTVKIEDEIFYDDDTVEIASINNGSDTVKIEDKASPDYLTDDTPDTVKIEQDLADKGTRVEDSDTIAVAGDSLQQDIVDHSLFEGSDTMQVEPQEPAEDFGTSQPESPKKMTVRITHRINNYEKTRKKGIAASNKKPKVTATFKRLRPINSGTNTKATRKLKAGVIDHDKEIRDIVSEVVKRVLAIWQQTRATLLLFYSLSEMRVFLRRALQILHDELVSIEQDNDAYRQFYYFLEGKILGTTADHAVKIPSDSFLYHMLAKNPCRAYYVFFRFLSLLLYCLKREMKRVNKVEFAKTITGIIEQSPNHALFGESMECKMASIFQHCRKHCVNPGELCHCRRYSQF